MRRASVTWASLPSAATCMTAAATWPMPERSSPAPGRAPSATAAHGSASSSRCSSTYCRPSSVRSYSRRRVDRAGARAPGALAAALDLLHEPVAVARLLGEQDEQGGADVAAPGAPAEVRAAEARGERGPVAVVMAPSPASSAHGEPAGG